MSNPMARCVAENCKAQAECGAWCKSCWEWIKWKAGAPNWQGPDVAAPGKPDYDWGTALREIKQKPKDFFQ